MRALHEEKLSKFTHGGPPLPINVFIAVCVVELRIPKTLKVSQFLGGYTQIVLRRLNAKAMQAFWRLPKLSDKEQGLEEK